MAIPVVRAHGGDQLPVLIALGIPAVPEAQRPRRAPEAGLRSTGAVTHNETAVSIRQRYPLSSAKP
ncbi:MAG: hypothetical protein NZ960_02720 [Candidatus Kapabacteria bacterium]|nr:hypothetical protein [Candidatus Kapabacteria bacterium]MDW8012426.1 hypothetical protein [Bacteroidota bacterium]